MTSCPLINKKRLNKFTIVVGLIILYFFINSKIVEANEDRVIKVGYPTVKGFTEINDGIYSGYSYDYLIEISKYTGWEYEFIEMSLEDAMNKLRTGELDLVSGMLKNDQALEIYDYPEYSYGATYTVLSVLKDNQAISSSNYDTLNGIKVGYFENSKIRINNFKEYCEYNGIKDIELIPYPNTSDKILYDALKNKEVDAIITGDLLINDDEKIIARFKSTPYYFATTKGNTDLVQELNKAIAKIQEYNPTFQQELYSKYFLSYIDRSVVFSEVEQEFINNASPLRAIYVDDYLPFQIYNHHTKKPEGFYIDFINLVSQKSGLKFELIKTNHIDEAYEMIKNKEADLIIGTPNDYANAEKYSIKLTIPYISLEMISAINNKKTINTQNLKIALPRGYGFRDINEGHEIIYYDSWEECLKAVQDGIADCTYGDYASLINYIAMGYYPSLSINYDDYKMHVSIGLSKSSNHNLINIVNKVVTNISKEEIRNIMFKNILKFKQPVTLKQFFLSNLTLSFTIIFLVLGSVAVLIFTIVKLKFNHLNSMKTVLLEKSQTDTLTGIYNRGACEELVKTYLKTKDPDLYYAFIIIDIDYFKQVNDYLGHKTGDDLLIEFSQLLKKSFSRNDIICRWGGDEFIVFMKDIEEINHYIISDRLKTLCERMDKEVISNGKSQKISLSAGALISKQRNDFTIIYKAGDELLYEAKRNGKNGFKIGTL